MFTNFHTHTYRCHHAGTAADEEYVLAAIEKGYKTLGFSDHCPWPYDNGYVSSNQRMLAEELDGYISSIKNLKEKYVGQIEIRLGLEVEYFPKYYDWLKSVLPRFDYVILGNHFGLDDSNNQPYYGMVKDPLLVEQYTAYTIAGMATGMFAYLAHPDVVFGSYPVFDDTARTCSRMICYEAKALDIPLEYNLYGVRKIRTGMLKGVGYPADPFWETAADMGCKAIIGVDAHDPEILREVELFDEARAHLQSLGLKVIEDI